jgi:hypothetical protein
MSMTQPMTTLTRGQFAPLLLRSLPVLRSTLPHLRAQRHLFLRRDFRLRRADYFANPSLNRTRNGVPRLGLISFWPKRVTPPRAG